ncbi:MAG: glycosyltransferase family 4 protein [Cytophagaceae bacterium]|nr:glycosyltransferase family 4 protein [Cytophagaceae bacterium]MDW8456002.1 glycosyltransferase family 4 protein [Cytophagaceae bacterium]
MKTLKLLVLTNRIPYPLNDGGNIATYYVLSYLKKFGHSVTLAALNTSKHRQDPKVVADIAEVHTVDIDTRITAKGLVGGIFKSIPYNVERFFSIAFANKLEKILNATRFDIIQLEGIYLSIYLDVLRRNSDAPVVLRSHNIEHEIWERLAKNESNILKKLYISNLSAKIKNFEIENAMRYDGIIAITKRDEDFYRKIGYKGPLKTINAGVEILSPPIYLPPASKIRLCFIGSMEWQPNIQGLYWFIDNVWPVITSKFENLEFHIAGKNTPKEFLQLNIKGITVHGEVPDARTFLQQYEVMLVPLLSGGGMRLKIVEAMALGKCIISTSTGAEGIDVQHGKNILIANQVEEFSLAISMLYKNPALIQEIGSQAYETALQKYRWNNLVAEFENFYLGLL